VRLTISVYIYVNWKYEKQKVGVNKEEGIRRLGRDEVSPDRGKKGGRRI